MTREQFCNKWGTANGLIGQYADEVRADLEQMLEEEEAMLNVPSGRCDGCGYVARIQDFNFEISNPDPSEWTQHCPHCNGQILHFFNIISRMPEYHDETILDWWKKIKATPSDDRKFDADPNSWIERDEQGQK